MTKEEQKQFDAANKSLAASNTENEQLKADLAAAKEALDTANADKDKLQDDFDASLATIDEATAEIEDLKAQLVAAGEKVKASQGPTFKDGKSTYEFSVKAFRFKGLKYTAEAAVENKDLMKELIKAKCSFLKKQ